ncbi:MAG: CBS domain-containing protein [Rhodocyclaceae bacterium]|nr:CBS domain-containing protein [Rhodocyclaceae bacterium]
MKTVRQMLEEKRAPITSVGPRQTVIEVLKIMAERNIGSVLVLEGDKLVGIFTERDYARKVVLEGKHSQDLPVSAVMTDKVIYVTPERTSGESMAIMTEKRCRHLPVLDENSKVIGIISIGDLVKDALDEQKFIIEQLVAYIAS